MIKGLVQGAGAKGRAVGALMPMGIAAMKLMAAEGLAVPRDVAITGFNAFEFWQYTTPVLTTVRSPAYEMGARGGGEILARLNEGRFAAREIVYPVALQPGAST